MATSTSLPPLPLPGGITSHFIDCTATNGLTFHILSGGHDPTTPPSKPLLLFVHGFPELAFSWRLIMPAFAAAGYHVVALDQRGYGRTTGWDDSAFEKTDFRQFNMTTLVSDLLVLVSALGYKKVDCIVGHDFGAVAAAFAALMRPDIFRACITMSHPSKGSPAVPFGTAYGEQAPGGGEDVQETLAKLDPPRKHYKWYNSMAPAAKEWENPKQGMHTFLRGYLHVKSADWAGNTPHQLQGWTAKELAKMPEYYILPLHATMPEAIAGMMRGEDEGKTVRWMPEEDLAVYVQEWTRTGFQGGLNWYRATTDPNKMRDMLLFAGRKIEVPALFLTGESDWGNYQEPGAMEGLPKVCTQFKGIRMVPGAGHWPQQEQPEKVTEEILAFLKSLDV